MPSSLAFQTPSHTTSSLKQTRLLSALKYTKHVSIGKQQPSTSKTSSSISSRNKTSLTSGYASDNDESIGLRPPTRKAGTRSGRPQTSASMRDFTGREFLVAVIEGRGVASEVGMCFIDLRTSECILSQIADSQTYVKTLHKINIYNPSEILFSITAVEPQPSKFYKIIEENFPSATLTPIGRKYFNNVAGLEYIQRYGLEEDSQCLLLGLTSKYYCLSATAAALKYVETTQNMSFINHTVKFKYQGVEGTMMIDMQTARNLELITNIINPKSNHSLFGIMNHTATSMGARLLRTNILQPLTDIATINTRLNSVEELTQNEETFFSVQTALKSFQDIDHLITALIKIPNKPTVAHAEQSINHVIMLKHILKSIKPVVISLSGIRSTLLVAVRTLLSDPKLDVFESRINEIINEDVAYQKSSLALRNQRCYAVKAGVNGLLDVARQTYKEAIDDIYELVENYNEIYQFTMKVQYNSSMGFILSTTTDALNSQPLPLVFINVVKKKKIITFTTLELIQKNNKINQSLTEVYLMSDKTIADLIDDIRSGIGALYKASESIAMLDMLTSFAHLCTISSYTRPEFTDTLAIKSGRHPIRERIYLESFVPNDTYASEANNFQLITGPNMSGKSTYLRQIALMCIISQVGCFVPAEYASFRIVDHLFSRICNDDSIETNASTFMVEMLETAYILQNITDESLIIIDELGRGTSTHDALGITYAVCEKLLESKAIIFFATHFHELTTSLSTYPNVVNLHLEVEIANISGLALKYLYTIKDGSTTEENYGLRLAQMIGYPQDIIDRATSVSTHLKEIATRKKTESQVNKVNLRRKALLSLAHRLSQVRNSSNMSEEALKSYLKSLQDEFIKTMEMLD